MILQALPFFGVVFLLSFYCNMLSSAACMLCSEDTKTKKQVIKKTENITISGPIAC